MARWRILLASVALSVIAAGCVNKAQPMSPFTGCMEACTNQCMVDGDCNLASGMDQEEVDACEKACGSSCKETCKDECKSDCPPSPYDQCLTDCSDECGEGCDLAFKNDADQRDECKADCEVSCRKETCGDECKFLCSEVVPEDTVVEPDTVEDIGGGDDALVGPELAGGVCAEHDDCAGELECFTKEYLIAEIGALVDWTYDIPGGMCSKLFCNVAEPTGDECGDGGFCFDVGPLFDAGFPAGLCLQYCEDSFDCRWQEGYLCYYTGREGERACLPTDLILEIPCGDGVCGGEMAPSETAETCPRDCEE